MNAFRVSVRSRASLVFIVILALLLSTLGAAPSDARSPTYTVDTAADLGGTGACTSAAGDCSLRQALAKGGRIVLPDLGGGTTYALTLGPLVATKSTSISGAGRSVVAVDADFRNRVLSIGPGIVVTLSGVTLRNGRVVGGDSSGVTVGAPAFGSGILNRGNLTLIAVAIEDNLGAAGDGDPAPVTGGAGGNGGTGGGNGPNGGLGLAENSTGGDIFGGGIYNEGSLLIRDSEFTNNLLFAGQGGDPTAIGGKGGNGGTAGATSAGGNGGNGGSATAVGGDGGSAFGAAIYNEGGRVAIRTSLFSGNGVFGGNGGFATANGGNGGTGGNGNGTAFPGGTGGTAGNASATGGKGGSVEGIINSARAMKIDDDTLQAISGSVLANGLPGSGSANGGNGGSNGSVAIAGTGGAGGSALENGGVRGTIIPDTLITKAPARHTTKRSATFEFRSDAASAFECRLDGSDADPFTPCTSPKTVSHLRVRRHRFEVRAKVGNARDRTPAFFEWTVKRPS